MGMWTMRTPYCDEEAEARAEARAEHLANLDPRDHDGDDIATDKTTACPECGAMDSEELCNTLRHANTCMLSRKLLREKWIRNGWMK